MLSYVIVKRSYIRSDYNIYHILSYVTYKYEILHRELGKCKVGRVFDKLVNY